MFIWIICLQICFCYILLSSKTILSSLRIIFFDNDADITDIHLFSIVFEQFITCFQHSRVCFDKFLFAFNHFLNLFNNKLFSFDNFQNLSTAMYLRLLSTITKYFQQCDWNNDHSMHFIQQFLKQITTMNI